MDSFEWRNTITEAMEKWREHEKAELAQLRKQVKRLENQIYVNRKMTELLSFCVIARSTINETSSGRKYVEINISNGSLCDFQLRTGIIGEPIELASRNDRISRVIIPINPRDSAFEREWEYLERCRQW